MFGVLLQDPDCLPDGYPTNNKQSCACFADAWIGSQMAPGSQAASAEGREELGKRLAEAGLPMFGVLPRDPLLASVRLDEIQAALQARAVAGGAQHPDAHFDKVSNLLAVVGLIAMLYTAPTNFLLARVDMKVNLEAPSPAERAKGHLRSTKRLP